MPKIRQFTGINNVKDAERAKKGDFQVMDNCIIRDDQSVEIRDAKHQEVAGNCTSVFATKDHFYYVLGSDLYRKTNFGLSPTLLASAIGNADCFFTELNDKVYWCNGTNSGIVHEDGSSTSWGCDETPLVQVVNGTGGTIPKGKYLYTVCHVLSDGQEGPAMPTREFTIDDRVTGMGIWIFTPSDSRITHHRVYMSSVSGGAGRHGEHLKLVAEVPVGYGSFTIKSMDHGEWHGASCHTLNKQVMPAGRYPAFYRGRMYVAVQDMLVYSDMMSYELTQLDHNQIPCGAYINNILPVENGIWVTTEKESFFLAGRGPDIDGGFQIQARTPGFSSRGGFIVDANDLGGRKMTPGPVALWVADGGIYAGDGNGQLRNVSGDYWVPPAGDTDYGYVGCVHGPEGEKCAFFCMHDFVYAMNLSSGAITRFENGDYHNSRGLASFEGTLIGCNNTQGLFAYNHPSDENATEDFSGVSAQDIEMTLTKNGISFGDGFAYKITDLYMHLKSAVSYQVVVTSETGTCTVTTTDAIMQWHGSKTDLARGVRGRDVDVTINSVDGEYLAIKEMEFITDISPARRGRQNIV